MPSTGAAHVRHGGESREANSHFRHELAQRGIPVIGALGEKQGGGGLEENGRNRWQCPGIRSEGLGFRDEHDQRVAIHAS